MERNPHNDAQAEQQRLEQEEISRQIDQDIRQTFYEGHAIANVTAKRIAEILQPGSGPLYDFATTGAVDDEIYSELDVAREVVPDLLGWVQALEDYCLGRIYHDPVPGWHELEIAVSDNERIYYGITEALHHDRPIDHSTARAIAAQLHGGQASALYALASSGVMVEGLALELDTVRRDASVQLEPWLDALDEYLAWRDEHHPIEGSPNFP
jgi:hypothetical protein